MKSELIVGDASRVYHSVLPHLLASLWTDVRNAQTCAWMVTGVLLARSSTPSDWVAGVLSKAQQAQSTERRFARWLNNEAIDPVGIYGPLVLRSLKSWGKSRLVLALDTSVLFEGWCWICVVIIYRGRAVPLSWRVIEHPSAQVSFTELAPLLADVQGMLEAQGVQDILLLADRGFADTTLMSWLKAAGWNYRIRIKANLKLYAPKGKLWCKVGEVALKPGEAKFYQGVYLTEAQFGPVHVAFAQPHDADDAWQVVSSEPTSLTTFEEYGWRFNIEEFFLDDKSGAFQLEDSHLRDAGKLERLLLVLALSLLMLVSQGTQIVAQGIRRTVDPHWQRGLSYLKIGWRSLNYALSRGLDLLTSLELLPGPDPEKIPPRKGDTRAGVFKLDTFWNLAFRPRL